MVFDLAASGQTAAASAPATFAAAAALAAATAAATAVPVLQARLCLGFCLWLSRSRTRSRARARARARRLRGGGRRRRRHYGRDLRPPLVRERQGQPRRPRTKTRRFWWQRLYAAHCRRAQAQPQPRSDRGRRGAGASRGQDAAHGFIAALGLGPRESRRRPRHYAPLLFGSGRGSRARRRVAAGRAAGAGGTALPRASGIHHSRAARAWI